MMLVVVMVFGIVYGDAKKWAKVAESADLLRFSLQKTAKKRVKTLKKTEILTDYEDFVFGSPYK